MWPLGKVTPLLEDTTQHESVWCGSVSVFKSQVRLMETQTSKLRLKNAQSRCQNDTTSWFDLCCRGFTTWAWTPKVQNSPLFLLQLQTLESFSRCNMLRAEEAAECLMITSDKWRAWGTERNEGGGDEDGMKQTHQLTICWPFILCKAHWIFRECGLEMVVEDVRWKLTVTTVWRDELSLSFFYFFLFYIWYKQKTSQPVPHH